MLILYIGILLLTLAGWLINRSVRAAQRQKDADERMYRRAALAATQRRRIDSEHFRG